MPKFHPPISKPATKVASKPKAKPKKAAPKKKTATRRKPAAKKSEGTKPISDAPATLETALVPSQLDSEPPYDENTTLKMRDFLEFKNDIYIRLEDLERRLASGK